MIDNLGFSKKSEQDGLSGWHYRLLTEEDLKEAIMGTFTQKDVGYWITTLDGYQCQGYREWLVSDVKVEKSFIQDITKEYIYDIHSNYFHLSNSQLVHPTNVELIAYKQCRH